MDPDRPRAEAVAITGNRILAVGKDEELLEFLAPDGKALDLRGRTVLSGFTDSHIHLLGYGLRLGQIDLSDSASKEEALNYVAERAKGTAPGRWLQGGGWDRNEWPDSSFPTRAELDRVAPRNPVTLPSKDGHALWVNSHALELAEITVDTPDPEGGEIVRDPATGEPTGILKERAIELMRQAIPKPDPGEIEQALAQAISHLHRVGLTGIHDCEGAEVFTAFQRLASRGELKLRVLMHIPLENLDSAIQLGLHTGLGDELLRIGSVKMFADGSLGSRTAAMLAPYEDEPGNRGIMVMSDEELMAAVGRACQAGIAPAVHAIGDRATHAVLDAYEVHHSLWAEQGLRPRVEHAQLLTPEDIPRFGRLDVIASMQPIHCTADMKMVDRHWGARGAGAYAFRGLLDAGAHLAFGSDCPVEDFNPLAGIHAAVTRRRADGSPGPQGWHPSERITVADSVRAYTLGAAYASGEEQLKGSISPGKLADLVVLSQDIFAVEPMDILQTEVVATIFDGKVVYWLEH
ncbi:MAG: amidohydrolase [Chloroflexota bacterium]|nr:amidohydrolase [Chloroflexota bacterium]